MASDFTTKLLDLIFSPYGLVGIFIGIICLEQARRSRRLAWLLFSVCCYATSLGKFQNEWIKQPPALVFPLENLRDLGRPLSIVLLALLLVLGLQTKKGWRSTFFPEPIQYLIIVQGVIFLKTLIYGSPAFALLSGLTFGAVVPMIKVGPNRWLQDEENFHLAVWSLAMGSSIFAITNAYQVAINISAVTFVQGRFLGTTGNPQQAASLLATTVPCFMFLIETQKKWGLVKAFWLVILFVNLYFLFLTGSRTGLITGLVSILGFYRNRLGKLLRIGAFASLALGIFLFQKDPETTYTPLTDRYTSGGNTRSSAWAGMWDGFINYPIFGAPLEGDRLGFGESTWLATASTTGLIGFIPLILMGIGCLKMIFQLIQLSSKKSIYFLECSTIIAGLASLLIGSFSEAILLGTLTFPVMAFLIYLSLGKYLLDSDHVQNKYLLYRMTSYDT